MNFEDKKKESGDRSLKRIEEALKAFQDLGAEDSPFDQLFPRLKSHYDSLEEHEKEGLFRGLIEQIEVKKAEIDPLAEAVLKCEQDDPRWASLLADFRNRAYSPRLSLFRKISRSPGGLKFLLDFRGDLLSIRRHSRLDLDPLDSDIIFLFEMLFQEGFIYLEEITLDSAYKQIELIKNRDLVHPMASIEEMGQRLGKDRRCFALYHRLLPYEPIIFIEVALTDGLVRNISQIMAGA
ncbi:MAG: malonyl-CoA decarboxylase family protein, partial [Desulfatiglandaceae bacterium]